VQFRNKRDTETIDLSGETKHDQHYRRVRRSKSDGGSRFAVHIKHFSKRLVEETDETKLRTIFNLIAEERAKLDALMDLTGIRPGPLKRVVAE
jgi:hypothetical protein